MTKLRTKFRNTEDRDDYYSEVLADPWSDTFAKALDHLGWMIVPQKDYDDGRRWPMNEHGADCPSWADNAPGDVIPLRPVARK